MRVRTYGLMLLALVGIAPLGIYGAVAIERSQQASIEQVRQYNQHLATVAAVSIRDHLGHQQQALSMLGVAVLHAADPQLAHDAVELDPRYEDFFSVVVYRMEENSLVRMTGVPPADHERVFEEQARAVVHDRSSPLMVTPGCGEPRFGPFITIAEPIVIAGRVEGVVVAGYDLVGIWMTIDAIRIASTGFIRLVSSRGETIAHGHPDERRAVFMDDDIGPLLAAATHGHITRNGQGHEIVVAEAAVPGVEWRDPNYRWSILVEQSVDEALVVARDMRRALIAVGVGVLLFAIVMAVVIGRNLVRGLETLRAHTRELPGDLERRLEFRSPLRELSDLANAIDGMAVDLVRERDEAQKRERLTTFAGVAAGLAHDLRLPIENVRDACAGINESPDDEGARDWLRQVTQVELPRLKRFVDDLQRLARQGQLALAIESIDPRALIEDVAAEVAGARKWSGVAVEVRGHAGAICGDRYLLRRAVLNLASNAADACLARGPGQRVILEIADGAGQSAAGEVSEGMAEGTGESTVRGTGEGSSESMVEIRVIDTGEGMAPETLSRLERGDFFSTKRTTGFGLGLGVVWRVAASHQGTLTIASEREKGSMFTMRLPRAIDTPGASGQG